MAEAQRRLLAAVSPIERIEAVPLTDAFGRMAARRLRAPSPVPSFARATWDGYAVRAADTVEAGRGRPVRLRLVGEVFAEQRYAGTVRPGEAVAIATGGALPRGADGVIIFEDVRVEPGWLHVPHPVHVGDRVAPAGDDFPHGAVLTQPGEELTPAVLGALAACGFATVPCFARPVVAIVPNGNELSLPGSRVRPGTIFESNNVSLSAIIRAGGGEPKPVAPVPDDARRIEAALRRALRTADLVLATGGSSVGERDLLPRVLPRLGPLLFHGIAVRPGKPTLAARAGRKLIVGLPGHPSSCLANSYWAVLPLLWKMGRRPGLPWVDATERLGRGVIAPTPGLATVVPVRTEKGRVVSTFHGSSSITSMSGARGFLVLPPGRGSRRAGDAVEVHWLRPPLGPGGGPSAPNG